MPSPAKVLKVEDVCNPAVCQPSLLQNILGDINITKCEPAKSPIEQAEDQVTNRLGPRVKKNQKWLPGK